MSRVRGTGGERRRPRRRERRRVPLPAEPTSAPPGSLAKLAVLERRAAQRVALFHPDDA